MSFHRYDFSDVTQYLHHRPPYLLVDRVVTCSDSQVVTEKRVTGDEFFLRGHFPGAPIFPGAMMQEFTTQSAGVLIAARYNPMSEFNTSDPHFNRYALGVLVRVNQARYYTFARPGDLLTCTVSLQERLDQLFDFRAVITINNRPIMRNTFQLTNIESSLLTGPETV